MSRSTSRPRWSGVGCRFHNCDHHDESRSSATEAPSDIMRGGGTGRCITSSLIADPESGVRHPIPLAELMKLLGPRLVKEDGKKLVG